MIQASISDVKNRLSHYLKLVRGGEEIEILDRRIPVARIVHVARARSGETEPPWLREMEQVGIVTPPAKRGHSKEFLAKENLPTAGKPGVLDAVLEERETGR
jgi:antitoxin (DNA-binding transcriptional repressor) of toxin-antitoxin stability system